jgi:hypothetical protein
VLGAAMASRNLAADGPSKLAACLFAGVCMLALPSHVSASACTTTNYPDGAFRYVRRNQLLAVFAKSLQRVHGQLS